MFNINQIRMACQCSGSGCFAVVEVESEDVLLIGTRCVIMVVDGHQPPPGYRLNKRGIGYCLYEPSDATQTEDT